MTITIDDTGHLEPLLVVEGYGGAYDAAGDLANFRFEHPLGVEEMYKLAAQLVATANRVREKRIAAKVEPVPRGPYVIVPARKRTPEEVEAQATPIAEDIARATGVVEMSQAEIAADLAKTGADQVDAEIAAADGSVPPVDADQARAAAREAIGRAFDRAVATKLYTPERMRAWNLELPDAEEVKQHLRGIMLDNLGGITVLLANPARMVVQLRQQDLNEPIMVQPNELLRFELRPLVSLVSDASPLPKVWSESTWGDAHPGSRRAAREVDYRSMADSEMVAACGGDAARWAAAFMQVALDGQPVRGPSGRGAHVIDEGLMLAWFANAIEQAKAAR